VDAGLEELAIHSNFVRDIQRTDHVSIHHHTKFDVVLEQFNETRRDTIYVVDGEGRLLGQVYLHDVKYYINDATLGSVVIAADLTRPIPHTLPNESLASIIERFDDADLDELPVVDNEESRVLKGRVTRRDLVTCLSEEVLGQRKLRAKLKQANQSESTFIELPPSCELAALKVPSSLAGRALDSLDLVEAYGITPIIYVRLDAQGREERVLPRQATVLEARARLVVLGEREAIETLRRTLGIE
jgi:CBS domain-containing protein